MCAFRGLRPLWPHPLAGIKASPSLLFSFSISSSALHERAGQQRSCNVGMFSYLNFIIDKSSSPGQLEFPPLLFFYSSSSRAFVSRIRRAAALWSRKGFSLNSIICNLYTFFYFTLSYVCIYIYIYCFEVSARSMSRFLRATTIVCAVCGRGMCFLPVRTGAL